ncbi:GLABROUS1 enhancer-binding protein family protein [Dioscorea alata]|uniref:GLABROUS1 enhancer-binding protein family protein n=1 Tax=Dioscorea alata TaxID=55571 RepID=A0ACB7U4S7_DIOAL|nr:GLABROUS1 enhancer-binding protein family protein [Dioscorea alata]
MASAADDDLHRDRTGFESGASDDTDSDDDSSFAPGGAAAVEPPPNPNPSVAASAADPQNGDVDTSSPELKRRHISELGEIRSTSVAPAGPDDPRRLFQRLFSDEDEIAILKGFLEFVTQRGTTHASYQYDTGPFYDQIKAKLQLEFSKNQLVEKLRRLKKKYRTAVARIGSGRGGSPFKSPHDRAAFELSRQIWSPTFKRPRDQRAEAENSNGDPNTPNPNPVDPIDSAAGFEAPDQSALQSRKRPRERSGPVEVAVEGLATPAMSNNQMIEETMRSCLSPLLKELLNTAISGPRIAGGSGSLAAWLNPLPFSLVSGGAAPGMDEKLRKQQIMELEVLAKRMDLVKEQIELKLAELKSNKRG